MESTKKILLIFLGFIFGLAVGLGGFFFFKKESKNIPVIKKEKNNFIKTDLIKITDENIKWTKPVSTKKGFPIFNSQTESLSIFSINEKELKTTSIKPMWGSAAAVLGASDAISSPDLYYTAYIDKNTQNLMILSNETFKEISISLPGEKVNYISGWSPDSKKLIYFINHDTLAIRRQGPIPWENKEKFQDTLDSGFYLFNIETGKKKKLYPIDYFVTFIDNTRILVKAGDDQYLSKRLIVFNLDTFEADYGIVKEEFGFGVDQFTFSQDGSKWTYTLSRNPTEDANIIYTDFPNREGIEIDKGGWADVQFPFISPQGSKIAYWKKEGYINDGVPRFTVWIYDVNSKNKEKFAEGMVIRWIDENNLIYRVQNQSVSDLTYYLLDLASRQSTKMN